MALGDSRAAAEPLQCVGRELLEERVAAENILANHWWKSILPADLTNVVPVTVYSPAQSSIAVCVTNKY